MTSFYTVVAKMTCVPAWSGSCSASDRSRIDSFFYRATLCVGVNQELWERYRHGERGSEPITGAWEQSPQQGPGAELEMGIEPNTPNSNPIFGLSEPNRTNQTVRLFEPNRTEPDLCGKGSIPMAVKNSQIWIMTHRFIKLMTHHYENKQKLDQETDLLSD